MALGTLGLIGAGLGAAGAISQAGAAKSAAKSQEAAANRQIDLSERIYEETVGRFQPFLQSGTLAQNALAYELGLGEAPIIGGAAPAITERTTGGIPQGVTWRPPAPGEPGGYVDASGRDYLGPTTGSTVFDVGGQTFDTREAAQAWADANKSGGTAYQGFLKTPGYDFQLSQGMDALQSTAAARGGLLSGATMQAAQGFGQGLANQEYGNYLSRLGNMAGSGQAAAGNAANAGANYQSSANNALAGIGNAQAAGAIGSANALSSGINNTMGWLGYMGARPNNSIFGGSNSQSNNAFPARGY